MRISQSLRRRKEKPLKKPEFLKLVIFSSSIPAAAEAIWGKECFVIPEYTFAVRVTSTFLQLSQEHTEYIWLPYLEAQKILQYDSNKTALWELNQRIDLGMLK